MTRSITAIYVNGVFRPSQPVAELPENASVRLTVEIPSPVGERVLGAQQAAVDYVAPDFDADLGDGFWAANG